VDRDVDRRERLSAFASQPCRLGSWANRRSFRRGLLAARLTVFAIGLVAMIAPAGALVGYFGRDRTIR